ncbi:hypothetical protein OPV22_023337 [Ensete ventricosum]|uniref:Uncharacterized protein n=1 Tax=Ensete ventricosum TaxID=4639 RepID=A0AAV8QNA5_ENSVE|nr:hypothetical protein OPV22_023337 [Ensete ventricosum]
MERGIPAETSEDQVHDQQECTNIKVHSRPLGLVLRRRRVCRPPLLVLVSPTVREVQGEPQGEAQGGGLVPHRPAHHHVFLQGGVRHAEARRGDRMVPGIHHHHRRLLCVLRLSRAPPHPPNCEWKQDLI